MIGELIDLLVQRSMEDRIFLVLVCGILLLLLVALAFAVLTVVLRYRNERRAARWSRLDATWKPLLLDVLSDDADPRALQERVGEADRIYFMDVLLRYARRLRGDELEALEELARPYLELAVERLDSPEAGQRAWSVRVLATLGGAEHHDVLTRVLDDESPVVAMVAARALAREGGIESARRILDHLDRYELWSRPFLSEMLASLGPDFAPDLEAVYLDEDVPPEVRAICAEALMDIGEPRSADLAVRVLESLDLEAVAIAGAGSPDGSPAKVGGGEVSAGAAGDADVRAAEVGDAEGSGGAAGDGAVSAGGVGEVGGGEVGGSEVGGSEVGGGEIAAFGDERELVITSLRLLKEVGQPRHLPVVRELMSSPDPVFRSLAVAVLGAAGDPAKDGPRVKAGLSDPSSWVALHAARALLELGITEELEALAESDSERADLAREVLSV